MKKTLMVGIIGLAATAATTFGQGGINFGTYNAGSFIGAPITYAASQVPPGKQGLALGSGFSAQLFFESAPATWTLVAGTTTSFFGTDGDLGQGAGFFQAATALVPGAPGPKNFYVYAFNTVGIGAYAAGEIYGQSAVFSLTTVDPGLPTYPDLGSTTYSAFTVSAIPEPSTFALAGLGLASLLIFRRRK